MITYVVGNLLQSPAQVLVNPVNTAGVMNNSHFKQIYPVMLDKYRQLCGQGGLQIGDLWLYKTSHKWILNFPTKAHWRDAIKLKNIELGLRKFAATYADEGIKSISFPLLGSGLGGLDWEVEVQPLLDYYLNPLPIPVFIHVHESDDRFAVTLDEAALTTWLHGVPQIPHFSSVWADLQKRVRLEPTLINLDNDQPFRVRLNADRRLLLTDRNRPTQELSANLLAAVWELLCENGYVMPGDMPGGERDSGPLVSLLAELDYVRPVWLARAEEPRVIGLQLVPPVSSLLRVVDDN